MSDKRPFDVELGDIQEMLVLTLPTQLEASLASPKRQASWIAEVQGQTVPLAGLVVKGVGEHYDR